MTPKEALEAAIAAVKTQTALAAAIGGSVKTGHVYYWLEKGVVPAEYCPAIEKATGVRCEDLCPSVEWSFLRQQPTPAPSQEAA